MLEDTASAASDAHALFASSAQYRGDSTDEDLERVPDSLYDAANYSEVCCDATCRYACWVAQEHAISSAP